MKTLNIIARRLVTKVAVRGAVVMTLAGAPAEYESKYVDLRGKLPRREGVEYRTRPAASVTTLVWHHTATRGQGFSSIAQYHTESKGWPEIGYHFGVNYRGVWYHLLDVTKWSNHTQGHNRNAIAAVLLGNYDVVRPTEEMKLAAAEMQWDLVERYDIKRVWLHRDTKPTACPGRHAVEFLRPMQFGPKPN